MENKLSDENHLFIGIHTRGIIYCDKRQKEGDDFRKVGFLPYDTLDLQIDSACPEDLRQIVSNEATAIQARRGELFQISTCNQYVRLG